MHQLDQLVVLIQVDGRTLKSLNWLQHFKKHARASMKNQVLLLMDNYKTHRTVQSLEFSKKNGIVLLTFPLHCRYKLPPLDVSAYGPLKTYYNAECGN